ncbi:MAG: phosphoserine phosphatase SerB [Pseudomonadales bacterium]
MNSVTLISITGEDQPGLTGSLMSLMAEHGIQVLDIGQAVIHRSLALGLLVSVPKGSGILKELLFHVHELNLQASFTDISGDDYERWVGAHGQPRYIVTLLARAITAEHIARIGSVTHKFDLNIEDIKRLSGRLSLTTQSEQDKACIEFSVRGSVADPLAVRQDFLVLASELDVDISFQKDTVFRRNRRLVCFDMDSTLIEGEVIDELAVLAGVGEQVSAITERAMRGELDFTQSLRQRVALLEGLAESSLNQVYDRLPITEGAGRLIDNLKRVGYRTAILSGGFTFFGHYLQQKLGIDYVYANELALADGKLTGQVNGQVVDGARKASLMAEIAEREHISLEQVIAVGDGANDLPMLSAAGLGIAFRAKPIVQRKAEHSISTLGLDGILYLLGFSDAQ